MDLGIVFKSVIVAAAILVGLGSTWLFKMKNDNPVEQIAENVIKEQTGTDVDLTPE